LETIRAYALERLGAGEEAARAARAHAEFFRDLVTSAAPASRSDPAFSGLALCLREIDNIRAALDWSFSPSGDTAIAIALTAAYAPVWLHSGLSVECRERTERALDSLNPGIKLDERLRLQLHMAFGLTSINTAWTVDRAMAALTTALDIAEKLNDMDARLWANYGLWMLHFYTGQIRAALPFAERQLSVASSIGEPFALVIADRLLATRCIIKATIAGPRTIWNVLSSELWCRQRGKVPFSSKRTSVHMPAPCCRGCCCCEAFWIRRQSKPGLASERRKGRRTSLASVCLSNTESVLLHSWRAIWRRPSGTSQGWAPSPIVSTRNSGNAQRDYSKASF
jgi:hypothetical protein